MSVFCVAANTDREDDFNRGLTAKTRGSIFILPLRGAVAVKPEWNRLRPASALSVYLNSKFKDRCNQPVFYFYIYNNHCSIYIDIYTLKQRALAIEPRGLIASLIFMCKEKSPEYRTYNSELFIYDTRCSDNRTNMFSECIAAKALGVYAACQEPIYS